MVTPEQLKHKNQKALFALLLLFVLCFEFILPALAQTKVVRTAPGATGSGDYLLSPDGVTTQNTVPNQYEDALGNLYRVDQASHVNQVNINDGVRSILEGESAPLVFQAAEQGQGNALQQAAYTSLNANLGAKNETYQGLHQWWKDDLVGNLFHNIGQLFGKWLNEFVNGWIADTAQYLTRFLKVFVLNPNIAVNGLNGQGNDGISPYIRQGADVMYGIAVDLLLLLFILCIWKFWADAAWQGAGNLMGPVGRLIFTAGLLLAWPTLYAFEIQITNEMITAIYANEPQQVLMLDYAMAQVVKGAAIAAGAGATSVFAPVLGQLATGSQLTGSIFYFANTLVFTILGGIIIAELVYLIILKAIQTALLTAQYMFAPIFLVFFATPDTESYATGYVQAFVETSLWTFVWVGLFKILVIILFSNFNPWGKILISIGVLQLMIQVPTFIGRAKISPASDFISAGLVFGQAQKGLEALKNMSSAIVDKGVNWFANDRFADKGLQLSKDTAMNGLPLQTSNKSLLQSLNRAESTESQRNKDGTQGMDSRLVSNGPAVKTPASGPITAGSGPPADKKLETPATKPPEKKKENIEPPKAKALSTPGEKDIKSGSSIPVPPDKKDPKLSTPDAATMNALAGAAASGPESKSGSGAENPELPSGRPPEAGSNQAKSKFEWENSLGFWNAARRIHQPVRKMMDELMSKEDMGLRVDQAKTSAVGSPTRGVERINLAQGANSSETAHALYAAGFANTIASDDAASDAARKAAMQAGSHHPRGLLENMAANWLHSTGSSWSRSAMAKERFHQGMFEQALNGSQAYVSGAKGNAFTDYLKARYGEWGPDQDAMAVHLISNPDSIESPLNKNVGPSHEACISSGILPTAEAKGAMQNLEIQTMHPSRRKQAAFAALSYTYSRAKEQYGHEDPAVFALAHGEMARSLPAAEVQSALAMYQLTGQDDIGSAMAPQFVASTANFAADTQKDFTTAYTCMTKAAPYAARRLGYISAGQDLSNIQTYSDLSAVIVPRAGESLAGAMQVIFESTASSLSTMETHRVPMTTVTNPALASEVFSYIHNHAPDGVNSNAGHQALNIVAKNLGTAGAPHTARTMEAMYSYADNGGSIEQLDQARIILATKAYDDLGSKGVNPQVIEVAMNRGYGMVNGDIPWAELERTAVHYQTGQVRDYKLAGVVGQLVSNNIPISKTNLQVAIENMSSNGGQLDADYVKAVVHVNEAVRSTTSSPIVFDTFARAEASRHGIFNANDLPINDVLAQLQQRDSSFSSDKMAQQICQISRQGGGFSDHQLQDPITVQMLLDKGTSHPYASQAINVVTRLVGSTEAYNHPQYIEVVQEWLNNDGKMRDMDLGNLNAAVSLVEARAHGEAQGQDWQNVKVSPSLLKVMQRDPSYKVTDHQLSEALVDKILRVANRNGGTLQ